MSRSTTGSVKNAKKSTGSDAADQLVMEISNSIAQRAPSTRKRRTPVPAAKPPVAAPAPAPVSAPAPSPVVAKAPVIEKKAESVVATAPVVEKSPEPVVALKLAAAPVAPPAPVPVAAPVAKAAPAVVEAKKIETPVPVIPAPIPAPVVDAPAKKPAAKKSVPPETPKSVVPLTTRVVEATEAATLCVFCYEDAETPIGTYVANTAKHLVEQGTKVHIFSRGAFANVASGVELHVVGEDVTDDLIDRVRSFARRGMKAVRAAFPNGIPSNAVLMGHEWASIPLIAEFAGLGLRTIFSIHSLETQRSDMKSALSQEILKIETDGLRAATSVLIQQDAAASHAITAVPECGSKIVYAHHPFSTRPIVAELDPGSIKAKYTIGPIDPTVLFIGDLDDRHGPDVLMKAVPQILKNNRQARFIFVGDGPLQWPLRVHARYLLLEHAVRIVGHVGGSELLDLIQAADVIAVPSRSKTEEWPILAAWAAKRPVLSTQAMIGSLLKHEENSVVTYANEGSMVWGVERLLFDEGLRKKVAENGSKTLESRFGWNCAAEQLSALLSVGAR